MGNSGCDIHMEYTYVKEGGADVYATALDWRDKSEYLVRHKGTYILMFFGRLLPKHPHRAFLFIIRRMHLFRASSPDSSARHREYFWARERSVTHVPDIIHCVNPVHL